MTHKVPRYFCSPETWNHTTPSFTEGELVNLARAAVLEKRGKPYLFNEDKMIKARLFPQISFHRRRREFSLPLIPLFLFICLVSLLTCASFSLVFDVDIVCDVQARQMKFVVEASRKEVMRLKEAGITPPQGDFDESSPEDPPEEGTDEGVPEYVP